MICHAVSDFAPVSGCRGIISTAPISLDDLDAHGPIISVPQQLQFTSTVAIDIISKAAGPAPAAAAAEQLSNSQLIAAALAHEQQQVSRVDAWMWWMHGWGSVGSLGTVLDHQQYSL